jgi:hypothetical protein
MIAVRHCCGHSLSWQALRRRMLHSVHMKRVQVQLTDDQATAVAVQAAATGQSSAAVMREILDEWIARHDLDLKWERALAAVGSFHSGRSDGSENHDDYFDDDQYTDEEGSSD